MYARSMPSSSAARLVRVGALDPARRAVDRRRLAQLEHVGRPRRPLLQIGHLHADRRVDAVGGLDEAREQDGARDRIEVEAVDLVAGGVDPHPVLGPEVARSAAERLGDVAVDGRERLKAAQEPANAEPVDAGPGGDVGQPEGFGVGGRVVRDHLDPGRPQRLPHAGRAGEEIGRRARPDRGRACGDGLGERPLRPEVLDHGPSLGAGADAPINHLHVRAAAGAAPGPRAVVDDDVMAADQLAKSIPHGFLRRRPARGRRRSRGG